MSDIMLHGVLNMPLPDDPSELDLLTWVQFRDRARQAPAEIERLRAERDALVEALTPSGDTKAAYIGEFRVGIIMSHPRLGEERRSVDVPWTTIKEIMKVIKARAFLNKGDSHG